MCCKQHMADVAQAALENLAAHFTKADSNSSSNTITMDCIMTTTHQCTGAQAKHLQWKLHDQNVQERCLPSEEQVPGRRAAIAQVNASTPTAHSQQPARHQ
jgi:hypothetical protein